MRLLCGSIARRIRVEDHGVVVQIGRSHRGFRRGDAFDGECCAAARKRPLALPQAARVREKMSASVTPELCELRLRPRPITQDWYCVRGYTAGSDVGPIALRTCLLAESLNVLQVDNSSVCTAAAQGRMSDASFACLLPVVHRRFRSATTNLGAGRRSEFASSAYIRRQS
jgi:hypothetical protein